jgi:FkbM family methyltransferase
MKTRQPRLLALCAISSGVHARVAKAQAHPLAARVFGREQHSQFLEDWALYEEFFANDTQPGTFVEMGAVDGIWFSNTLAYERVLNWTGVLIEPNPDMCRRLFVNRAAARTLCSGVSEDSKPITFESGIQATVFAALDVATNNPLWRRFWHHNKGTKHVVPSEPLGKLLRAVGVAKVDFFSLDVEGAEVSVLRTMDWTIPVRVWCIETSNRTSAGISNILSQHNYTLRPFGKLIDDKASGSWNDVWVWGDQWTPSAYTWSPWRQDQEDPEIGLEQRRSRANTLKS